MQQKALLCRQGPVVLDLLMPYPLVLLPPALGAQALPRRVAIVTASLFAQQVRLVHVYPPPPFSSLTHDAGQPGNGKNNHHPVHQCLYASLYPSLQSVFKITVLHFICTHLILLITRNYKHKFRHYIVNSLKLHHLLQNEGPSCFVTAGWRTFKLIFKHLN